MEENNNAVEETNTTAAEEYWAAKDRKVKMLQAEKLAKKKKINRSKNKLARIMRSQQHKKAKGK